MFGTDRFITLDMGASKLVLAEFHITKGRAPELIKYGIGSLDIEANSEADRSAYIVSTLRELMREHGIRPAPLLMCVSGQAVFPRYVKLPPVSSDKILQIVRYEAQQNVPFPIDQVVWDYQLVGGSEEEELNVMLVAVKTENVKALTDCVQAADLEPEIVDVAPMALYNAVRYNYSDLQGCTMVLDVGARSSNLIFIEQNRIFTRSIPVAGNTITQEVMKEFDVSFQEAEELKISEGFVAFGGVYAGADNERTDRVSKIVRNVVTRLHAEVNRSINFYRSQQAGNPPSVILLTGGSSIIPHMDTFFREKLKAEVEYLNPFVNVGISEQLDTERVEGDVHRMGEVVGLALRRSLACPVEINLMPPELVAKKVFRRRQPFFALAAVGLALIMLCWWVYSHRMRAIRDSQLGVVEQRIASLRSVDRDLTQVLRKKDDASKRLDRLLAVVNKRTEWAEILSEIHKAMLDGMWLRSVRPVVSGGMVTYVEISGKGFDDKLRAAAQPDATAIEVFRNRLRNSELFTDDTEIKRQPPMGTEAYAREFTIWVALKEPMHDR